MENDYEQLKLEISNIRKDYSNAKRLLANVQDFSVHFELLKNQIEEKNKEIDIRKENSIEKYKQIEELKNKSKEITEKIEANLNKVKQDIESMQTAYNEFSEIKGKISASGSEIDTLLKNARGLRDDIEKTKNEAMVILQNIKDSFAKIQEKITEIQTAYETFLEIKGKIYNKENGIDAVFNTIQEFKNKSKELFDEIKTYRDEAVNLVGGIKANKEKSDGLITNIDNNYKFSEEKKKEIEDATSLIVDTSFSHSFQKRKREIEDDLNKWYSWKYVFIISIVLLVGVILWLSQHELKGLEGLTLVVTRIFYTSPLLFLIAFSSLQYTKERDLMERYAFKSATSATIRNHIDFLVDFFGKENKEIIEFAKNSFATIYTEQYENTDIFKAEIKKLKKELTLNKKEKDNNKKMVNKEEIAESIKQLKNLVPDEKTLTKIITLLVGKY